MTGGYLESKRAVRREGHVAYRLGVKLENNPYEDVTERSAWADFAAAWRCGWVAAKNGLPESKSHLCLTGQCFEVFA